jgi:hypothetical protein
MFVLVFLCCAVLGKERSSRRADQSSKGALPRVEVRLRMYEATKVLSRILEPQKRRRERINVIPRNKYCIKYLVIIYIIEILRINARLLFSTEIRAVESVQSE